MSLINSLNEVKHVFSLKKLIILREIIKSLNLLLVMFTNISAPLDRDTTPLLYMHSCTQEFVRKGFAAQRLSFSCI